MPGPQLPPELEEQLKAQSTPYGREAVLRRWQEQTGQSLPPTSSIEMPSMQPPGQGPAETVTLKTGEQVTRE